MSTNQDIVRLPLEFLANIKGKAKPYMSTWLKLKTKNKSGHYKNYKKSYKSMAQSISVSESTLRNHIKEMISNGFATINNDTLRLVSVWRNPISFKDRRYTEKNYGRFRKLNINTHNLKLEVFQAQFRQQVERQNYRERQRLKLLGKKPKNKVKKAKSDVLTNAIQNGTLGRLRDKIYFNDAIPSHQKENAIDSMKKCLEIGVEAWSHYVVLKEGNSVNKSAKVSLNKICDITGFKSKNSVRLYKTALKLNSGLVEEIRDSKIVIGKKFVPHYHYKDKFGNIFKKECYSYNVDIKEMKNPITMIAKHTNKTLTRNLTNKFTNKLGSKI